MIHIWSRSISACDAYLAGIHLLASISGCNPSLAVIHLRLWSSWVQPFFSTMCIIALLWAAFRDFSCSSVSSLKVIVTDLHNVRLSLILHRSAMIRWYIIHHQKIPTLRSVHMAWDVHVELHDPASSAHDLNACNCVNTAQLLSTQIWQNVAGLQFNCNWLMRRECRRLGLAENLHKMSVHHWISPPPSVGTIFVVVPAPSGHFSSQFVIYISGAVRRNTRESGFKRFRPCKSQAPPSGTPFVSWRAGSSHSRSALSVHASAATTAAAPCSPVQCLVPIPPLEMLSMVTPSSPIQTPTLRRNVQMTSSLAGWSSKALAPTISISGTTPPPSEHASSLAVIEVHTWGMLDAMPSPLPPCPLTLRLQSQKLNALQVNANSPAHTLCPPWLPPCVQISSLSESHPCHTQLGLTDYQILSIPTSGYDTSIEPPHAWNTHRIRWSPESAQTVHSPVAPWILRILTTK